MTPWEPFPPWTWDIPEHFNIAVACTDAHLGTAAASRPAVIVDDDRHGQSQLDYATLADRTGRFAQLLRDLGVDAGERVLIRLPNCLEYPVAFLGAMKRGAVPVPTSMMLTEEELLYVARDAGARVLVTEPATWARMHAMLGREPALAHVLLVGDGAAAPALPALPFEAALAAVTRPSAPHPTRADDPAYLVYTSGTTGYPKGVLHAHRALLGRQPSSVYWFDFAPGGDRVLHAGKYNWTYTLGTGLTDPLYRGHTTIVHEGTSEAALWPRLLARHAATTFIAVPTIYRQILQKTRAGRADVPALRHCMSAGEHLSDEVLAAWRERFGLEIYEGLGMSECSYYMCQTRSRPVRPGSAGFIQPGHAIELLDPATLAPVPPNTEGMLCIHRSDPGLMLRYWNRPDETAACFRSDWFLTGDYARRDDEGYIWFLGRKDDLINSFGYRISPHEVDRVLKDHPEVADAAAVGEEVAPGKVLVVAYVTLRPGGTLPPEALIAYAETRLASYKAPRIVYLVDELPRTRNGKVLRRALTPALARAR
ncbi:MAG TPA: acyl-CoA synthetase [Polyangia bacterium]|nr:acyl-CoA synthetase [Polyangia bacterium]